MHVCVSRSFPIRKTTFANVVAYFNFCLNGLLSWRTLSWRAGTCFHCYCYFFRNSHLSCDCSTPQFILLIIFCMIISAAPIKKCQKLGTYITTTCQLMWWMQGRFCIYKFQNLPESRGNSPPPRSSSGRDNQYKLQVLFANPIHFSISYLHFSSC